MTASKCVTLAKYMLVFTGIIYLMSAGCLSYIGIWVFSTYDHYDEIADSSLTLLPASIILAISALMCIIGILACLAACKSSKHLLSVEMNIDDTGKMIQTQLSHKLQDRTQWSPM